MAEFPTVNGYRNFEQSVKRKARYIYDNEIREFLKAVMETSESRRKTLQKGKILCRAQRGFAWRTEKQGEVEFDIEAAYSSERMVPKAEYVGDGRANTRG